MSAVRMPLDSLSAKLLKTILSSKDQIIQAIRINRYSIDEARSLTDFLIRANKNKDDDVDILTIQNFLVDIYTASNKLIRSELIPAIAYYTLLLKPINTPLKADILLITSLDKPQDCNHSFNFRSLDTPVSILSDSHLQKICMRFIFATSNLSEVECEMMEKLILQQNESVKKNFFVDSSVKQPTLPYQYIFNAAELNDNILHTCIMAFAQLDINKMARAAYEQVLNQRTNEKPAKSLLQVHSLLSQESNIPKSTNPGKDLESKRMERKY